MQGIHGIGLPVQTGQTGGAQGEDFVARSLRKQLNELKNQLSEVSSDASITAEEKARKQQEIQQQILDLQNQLRQHQMDQRKETKRAKAGSAKTCGQAGMEAVISADSAVKNAEVQQSTASRMEGRAAVLKSEIKTGMGSALPSKLKELERAEQAAENAKAAQMRILNDAEQKIKDAAGDELETDKAEEKEKEKEVREEQEKEQGKAEAWAYGSDGKPVLKEEEPGNLGRA